MDIRKRLFRKPLTTVLWLLFVTVMTGFLTVSVTLWLSSRCLARTLDENHTAIAVRSDPGIDVHRQLNGGVTWTVDGRPFTTEDAAAMVAMDGVKAVRSHVLTGGSSPAFTPILDVRRELSWRANGDIAPYYNAVFAGELVKIRAEEESFYSSGIRNDANYLMLLFRLEDVLLLNGEFDEPMKNMQNTGGFIYKVDLSEDAEAASYFTEGQRYVVSGTFEPMVTEYMDLRLNGEGNSRFPAIYFVLDGGSLVRGNGYLESLSARNVVWSVEKGEFVYETVTGSVFPAAEAWDGDLTRFFDETPHEAWRTYRDAWQRQNHALPVIGTDRLETMFAFLHGDAVIVKGHSFTPAEYETGARVLILSEAMAERGGLQVGDTVSLSQYVLPEVRRIATELGETRNNPAVSYLRMDTAYCPEETFTLVGIYRQQAAWSKDTYAFTPNTVFIPRTAQISGGYGAIEPSKAPTVLETQEADAKPVTLPDGSVMNVVTRIEPELPEDIYGIYLSVELINGSVEEFLLALERSAYAGQFYAFDQGFEAVQKDVNGLSETAARLLCIAAGGWLLLLLLYLVMYQAAQRRNLGVMRSLGETPGRTAAYLFVSGMIVALCGIALGVLVCRFVLTAVQSHVLTDMLGAIDRTAYGGALVISEAALSDMVVQSGPGTGTLTLLGLGEAGIMGGMTVVHAWVLCRREPRELLEG